MSQNRNRRIFMDLFINLYHLFHKAMISGSWKPGCQASFSWPKKTVLWLPFWRYFVYLLLPGGLGILKTLFRFAWPNWMRDLAPISPRCTFPCPSCRWRDMSWPVVLVNFWRLPRRLKSPGQTCRRPLRRDTVAGRIPSCQCGPYHVVSSVWRCRQFNSWLVALTAFWGSRNTKKIQKFGKVQPLKEDIARYICSFLLHGAAMMPPSLFQ